MKKQSFQFKISSIFLCLFFINTFLASVNPQQGENLWELTARIGECIDNESTKLDWIESQNDLICSKLENITTLVENISITNMSDNIATLCSKIEKVDEDLFIHNEVVCSKLENLTTLVENIDITSMNDNLAALCSKIEKVDEDLFIHNEVICSKLEKLAGELETHNDVICSKLENISSKIDEIEFVGTCETLIFQSDIPFTISEPGVYCLAESVNFTSDTAITVAASDVILDLNEKKIDGSGGGSIGIAVNSGLQNITIQNGTLCNMNDRGINADAVNNLSFVSMSVSDSLIDSVVDMPSLISPITCLQIKDIKVTNVGIFKEFSIVSAIDSLVDSLIDDVDESCTLSSITGINVNCVTGLSLNNCQVLGCQGDGFALQATEQIFIQSCNALQNSGNGFVLDRVDTTRLKWCDATMNCFNGFCDSACNADNLYDNCIAKQNGVHGFNVDGGGKVLRECVASQNSQNGFNLAASISADASLDTTFGTNGIVITPSTTTAAAMAIQKDGKIVLIGSLGTDFLIARYNVDGSLDSSFGVGGLVVSNVGSGGSARDVTIQEDGKIIASGLADGLAAVVRYTVDGNLDLTFGNNGISLFDLGTGTFAQTVALQKDGKLVVAGTMFSGGGSNFIVARLTNDGTLDSTFGIGGQTIIDFSGNDSSSDTVFDLTLQKDGKIVVAGQSNAGGMSFDFAVARLNPDGSLDGDFNPTSFLPGRVLTNFAGVTVTDDRGRAVAIQKDGKIVVAGEKIVGGSSDFAVARYNSDGSLDPTFNPAGSLPGTVTTDFSGVGSLDSGFSVAIQKDGKIVVAGESFVFGFPQFAVARYKVNGTLDTSFNPSSIVPGTVTTVVAVMATNNGRTVAIQQDGRIVVGGGSDNNFALVRYNVFKQGVAVTDCLAEENGSNGFFLDGANFMVKNSSAINNNEDGFLLSGTTSSVQLLSNEALQNGNIGIENLGPLNQILNNRAFNNGFGAGTNYLGVALVSVPMATTGYWENVEP